MYYFCLVMALYLLYYTLATATLSPCCTEAGIQTLPPSWPLIFHQSPSSQEGVSTNHSRFRLRRKQSITGKENTIDSADFPQKSYIFFSFLNWQLTKSTTCGKSFITLGPNQTINNGLLCQSGTGVTGTINYYSHFNMTFGEMWCSSRTFCANWLNWWMSAKEMWIMRLKTLALLCFVGDTANVLSRCLSLTERSGYMSWETLAAGGTLHLT